MKICLTSYKDVPHVSTYILTVYAHIFAGWSPFMPGTMLSFAAFRKGRIRTAIYSHSASSWEEEMGAGEAV